VLFDIIVLFDIDGTLLSTGGAGRRAFARAFEAELGWPDALSGVALAGHTDPGIVDEVVKAHGGAPEDEGAAALRSRIFRRYLLFLEQELETPPAGCVLPGVERLLAELAAKDRVHLGLLTGNVADGAWKKLRRYKIGHRFDFGAFGDDAPTREGLLPVAVAALEERLGRGLRGARIAVVGDTPRDVDVARAHGALAVAVATGTHSLTELGATKPDHLLADLTATEALLQLLAGSPPAPSC